MSDETMPESVTPTDPGMLSPVVQRVLDESQALLGMREQGGENQGAIVTMVASPFLSKRTLARFMKGGDKEGDLSWCALYASYCWWKAWPGFKPYASSEVSGLWRNFSAVDGWCWQKGEGRLLEPGPADFVFFVHVDEKGEQKFKEDGRPDFRHVGLVRRFVAGDVLTIEGNASDAVRERSYHISDPQLYGFGRPRPTP